jgi:hypothetical protein
MRLNRRGSLTLETALMLPLLFSFVLGSLDLLKIGYSWVLLSKTVQEAAGWVSLENSGGQLSDIKSEAESLGLRLGLKQIQVTVEGYQFDWASTQGLRVNSAALQDTYLRSGRWSDKPSQGEPILIRGETTVQLGIGRVLFSDGSVSVKTTAMGYI